jgi:hypothetical protein
MNISNPPIQSLQLLFVINSLHQVESLLSTRARNLQSTFSTNGWVNSILMESALGIVDDTLNDEVLSGMADHGSPTPVLLLSARECSLKPSQLARGVWPDSLRPAAS